MTAHIRRSVLWGVIAALIFLVLLQGYVLAGGHAATMPVAAGVALGVGVAATGLSAALNRHLARLRRDRDGSNQRP